MREENFAKVIEKRKFGMFLAELRRGSHTTQRQLGRYVGVSNQIVSKWETGASLPEPDAILALARFFGISCDELLEMKLRTPTSDVGREESPTVLLSKMAVENYAVDPPPDAHESLIPEPSDTVTGDFFTTWWIQQQIARRRGIRFDYCAGIRDALTDELLFGKESPYHPLSREYRKGLIFLLDDGWDVPFGTKHLPGDSAAFGTLEVNAEKFASLGNTPNARLKRMRAMVEGMGYAGLGLWIATERAGKTPEETHRFYKRHAALHGAAGVRYWKVDWGRHERDTEYRRILTEEVHAAVPGLLVEHCVTQVPLVQDRYEENFFEKRRKMAAELLAFSDVYRLYDLCAPFEISETLSRLDDAFSAAEHTPRGEGRALVCAEGSDFIGAVLGCTLQIVSDSDAEKVALRFHRLSPPFEIHEAEYRRSEETLTDSLYFERHVMHWIPTENSVVSVTAPAVMARGCALPAVRVPSGERPFVAASRHPRTGVYAVGSFRRTLDPNRHVAYPADVTLAVEGTCVTVGIFGTFRSLTLEYPRAFSAEPRILAQDMRCEYSVDVTTKDCIFENSIRFDGRDLRTFAKSSMLCTDVSEPALLICVKVPSDKSKGSENGDREGKTAIGKRRK